MTRPIKRERELQENAAIADGLGVTVRQTDRGAVTVGVREGES